MNRPTLTLQRSDTTPFVIRFSDDIGGADNATFVVRRTPDEDPPVLLRTVGQGDLTIDGQDLVCTMSLAEAEALPFGMFIGVPMVRLGSANSWRVGETIFVNVLPFSGHVPSPP